MRWVDFLILLLEAYSETLRSLTTELGEEKLLQVLENYEVQFQEITKGFFDERAQNLLKNLRLVENPPEEDPGLAYHSLEMAVRELQLPSTLENYLLSYPFYRIFIESQFELHSRIPASTPFLQSDQGLLLVNEVMIQAEVWIKNMPIPAHLRQQTESTAWIPWLRFRTTALKQIGKRPLGPVY